jgi:putative membrane protein
MFQTSVSGGIYPVQLISSTFQILNKLLPMAYAINITKEVISLPMMDVIINNGLTLLIYPIVGYSISTNNKTNNT